MEILGLRCFTLRISTILHFIVLVIFLGGCASPSLTQIKQFGLASSSLGDHAKKSFELAANVSVDQKLYDVAADPGVGPKDSTYQGLFAGEGGTQLTIRLRALDQLSAYSNALLQIAEADLGKDIDEAGKDLNGALIGLRDTYGKVSNGSLPISDSDIGAISTVVNAIGKGIIEKKRRDAIKATIKIADPAVQKIAELIALDLNEKSDIAMFVEQSISNSRGSIQQAYNIERVRPGSTFEARYSLLLRARELYVVEVNTKKLFMDISQAASAVGKAHAALLKALESDNFSSAAVAKQIGELEVHVKSVQEFYSGVNKTNN